MAVKIKDDEGKEPMADDEKDDEKPQKQKDNREKPEPAGERSEPASYGRDAGKVGFFTLRKPGQGYWTRIGTAGGAALIVALVTRFVYTSLATRTALPSSVIIGMVAGLVFASAVVLWWVLNKPSVVEFFIATESEMKKVNWTSRKDLIGSTKVVIVFMFLIAAILFVIDIFFGYFFWLIKVLQHGPFA